MDTMLLERIQQFAASEFHELGFINTASDIRRVAASDVPTWERAERKIAAHARRQRPSGGHPRAEKLALLCHRAVKIATQCNEAEVPA